jgi:hypothetical protein
MDRGCAPTVPGNKVRGVVPAAVFAHLPVVVVMAWIVAGA